MESVLGKGSEFTVGCLPWRLPEQVAVRHGDGPLHAHDGQCRQSEPGLPPAAAGRSMTAHLATSLIRSGCLDHSSRICPPRWPPRLESFACRNRPRPPTPEVHLFTDGACSGNPGPGGWAFILRHPASGKEIERSGGEHETTNNRMELTAVVRGLETLTRPPASSCSPTAYTSARDLPNGCPNGRPTAGGERGEALGRGEERGLVAASSTNCCQAPTEIHAGSPATAAMPKTNAATSWPWRPREK